MTVEHLPGEDENSSLSIERDGRIYRAEMKRVYVDELLDEESFLQGDESDYLIAVSLFDETELVKLREEQEEDQVVCGILSK